MRGALIRITGFIAGSIGRGESAWRRSAFGRDCHLTRISAQRVSFPCPCRLVSVRDRISTWMVEDNAQVHPEGADAGGHKREGLRMESLGEVALALELPHAPGLTAASHPSPPHRNLQQQVLEVKSGLVKFEQEVLDQSGETRKVKERYMWRIRISCALPLERKCPT